MMDFTIIIDTAWTFGPGEPDGQQYLGETMYWKFDCPDVNEAEKSFLQYSCYNCFNTNIELFINDFQITDASRDEPSRFRLIETYQPYGRHKITVPSIAEGWRQQSANVRAGMLKPKENQFRVVFNEVNYVDEERGPFTLPSSFIIDNVVLFFKVKPPKEKEERFPPSESAGVQR